MIPYAGMNAATRALNTTDKWRRRTRQLEAMLYRAYVALEDRLPALADDIRDVLDEKQGRPGPKRKT